MVTVWKVVKISVLREVPPFLRSCHIFIQSRSTTSQKAMSQRNMMIPPLHDRTNECHTGGSSDIKISNKDLTLLKTVSLGDLYSNFFPHSKLWCKYQLTHVWLGVYWTAGWPAQTASKLVVFSQLRNSTQSKCPMNNKSHVSAAI